MVYGIDGKDKSRKQVIATDAYKLAGLALHTYNNPKVTLGTANATVIPAFSNGVTERLGQLIGKATDDKITIKASGLYLLAVRVENVGVGSLLEIAPYKGDTRLAYSANTFMIGDGTEVRVLYFMLDLNAGDNITFKVIRKNNKGCTVRVLDCTVYAIDWHGKVTE